MFFFSFASKKHMPIRSSLVKSKGKCRNRPRNLCTPAISYFFQPSDRQMIPAKVGLGAMVSSQALVVMQLPALCHFPWSTVSFHINATLSTPFHYDIYQGNEDKSHKHNELMGEPKLNLPHRLASQHGHSMHSRWILLMGFVPQLWVVFFKYMLSCWQKWNDWRTLHIFIIFPFSGPMESSRTGIIFLFIPNGALGYCKAETRISCRFPEPSCFIRPFHPVKACHYDQQERRIIN